MEDQSDKSRKDMTLKIRRDDLIPQNAAAVEKSACFVIIYGPNLGLRFKLKEDEELIIGRDADCGFVIPSQAISRRHSKVTYSNNTYYINDNGSTNGTYVNDMPLRKPIPLMHEDRVRLGNVILKFLIGDNLENKYYEELYSLSITDGLLGIPNRRHMNFLLEKEVSRAKRHSYPLSILIFDIDHFKNINDTYGHIAGDHILKQLVNLVQQNIRKEEFLCRYGGEEFVLIMADTPNRGAMTVAEKLRKAVESNIFTYQEYSIRFTISVGVATFDETLDNAEGLLRMADTRLYTAKNHGRNIVVGDNITITMRIKN